MGSSTTLPQLGEWNALAQHAEVIRPLHMRQLFDSDNNRFDNFSLNTCGLLLDYSKNRITDKSLVLLTELAKTRGIKQNIDALFTGKKVNRSEQRPALHTALRNFSGEAILVDGKDIMPEIFESLEQMERFTWQIHSKQWRGFSGKPITDVVNIGIGGSFLGPKLVSQSLKPYWISAINSHYVANIDGSHITEVLKHLNPETTLFIVASKSFSTPETLINAKAARQWFQQNNGPEDQIKKHFVAVTANKKAALEFGIKESSIFPMWDWVGGRYSLWSAIGLPIALTIGMEGFRELLHGAQAMDQHFKTAPLTENMPVVLALLTIWYTNFFDADSHAILPYDHYLRGLPAHLQQLDMESLGKSVTQDGHAVNYSTGSIIWGGVGANGQHAYHQLLHQGTHVLPADFIVPARSHNPLHEHHRALLSNCFSQSEALMKGKTLPEAKQELLAKGLSEKEADQLAPHKVIQGNRPSNTIIFDKSSPRTIGSLIALYEHKTFVQGVIWDINPFDQWGVELGKQLSQKIFNNLDEKQATLDHDASTNGLIQYCRDAKQRF